MGLTVATSAAQLRKRHLREEVGSALHLKRLSGELETLTFPKSVSRLLSADTSQ